MSFWTRLRPVGKLELGRHRAGLRLTGIMLLAPGHDLIPIRPRTVTAMRAFVPFLSIFSQWPLAAVERFDGERAYDPILPRQAAAGAGPGEFNLASHDRVREFKCVAAGLNWNWPLGPSRLCLTSLVMTQSSALTFSNSFTFFCAVRAVVAAHWAQ